MAGRNKRTKYNFMLGRGIERLQYRDVLVQADVQTQLAIDCVASRNGPEAAAHLLAAQEAILEARMRGEQLHLRM